MTRSEWLQQAARLTREQLLLVLAELHDRVSAEEERRREPIAITGVGCRFADTGTPDAFWTFLCAGSDGVRELPVHRRAGALAGAGVLRGAFLDDVSGFDAGFFGITPKEALHIDPQHRLFLELAWEAAESAGLTRERLAGSSAGVFAALCETYYSALQFAPGIALDAYSGIGASPAALAGRLSYLLDLRGPSVAVDTACSSALVAVHHAVRSLRAGECDIAFVGGVNVLSSRACLEPFEHMGIWSSSGRCRTFDAAGDGFVAGEGGAVFVLRRLRDALADRDPLFAVIRGSAVNHVGRAPGLTSPSGEAQANVIRAALADAGVDPGDVGYVEAHGTATRLGDPVEVEALAAALGPLPSGTRMLGSVKTNLGHLGGAAGFAGLLKAVLAVGHGSVPPHIHLAQLNPELRLSGGSFVIPTEPAAWSARLRVAGVSAFGWAGTNAHVVVAEAPAVEVSSPCDVRMPLVLPLSARSEHALRALAEKWIHWLTREPRAIADIAYTASCRRTHHPHRLAVSGDSAEAWAKALEAWLRGERATGGLAARYASGEPIRWPELFDERSFRCVPLPAYAWQKESFALETPHEAQSELEQWLQTLEWEDAPPAAEPLAPRGPWWICGRRDGVAGAIAAELRRRGCSAEAGLPHEIEARAAWHGIAFVRALDFHHADPWSVQRELCGALLEILQGARAGGKAPRLAIAISPDDLAHAPLRGFARAIAAEDPPLRCTLIEGERDGIAAFASELLAEPDASQVRLEGARRLVARLRSVSPSRLVVKPPVLDADGTYVVTGGFGALGLRVAASLAARGAGRVLLIGRNRPGPDACRAIESLRAKTAVSACTADVTDLAQLAAALEPHLASIRGVVHAAGTLDDAYVQSLDWPRFEAVLAPKLLGAWNLHRLLDGRALDFFALFSSAAGLTGNAGQTSYAAANTFLDALVDARRRAGQTAIGIQWGPWAEIGMAARTDQAPVARGARAIPPGDGIVLFERLVASPFTNIAVFEPRAVPTSRADAPLRDALASLPAPERRARLFEHVRQVVAGVTGLDAERIAPDAAFSELGIDSILSVEIHARLSGSLGVALPAGILWFHPTPDALAAHLASLLGDEEEVEIDLDELTQQLRDEIAAAGERRSA